MAKNNSPVQIPKISGTVETPSTGYAKLYSKADGKLYYKDDSGTEVGPLTVNNTFIQSTVPDTALTNYVWFDTSQNPPTIWVTI